MRGTARKATSTITWLPTARPLTIAGLEIHWSRFSVSSRCNFGEGRLAGNTLVTRALAFTATSTGITLGLNCVSDKDDDAMAAPPSMAMPVPTL